jgi:peroxiredoxin
MIARWIVAAATAAGIGLLAVPAFLGRSEPVGTDAPSIASNGGRPTCKAEKANLNFTVKDMSGTDVRLTDYKGKVILLNFWATWCGPCKIEIPHFIDLYAQYKDQGFVVLGVSGDDDAETLRAYASDMKMNYPVLVGRDHEDLLDAYGPLFGYPTSFFIGRDGSICGKQLGPASKEDFERAIKALL